MLKRRNIREAAVQFLYLTDFEETSEPAQMPDNFWHIIQENGLRKLTQAKAKAIIHTAQARENPLLKLTERAKTCQPELKTAKETTPLSPILEKILTLENQLTSDIDLLKKSWKNNTNEELPANLIASVISTNQSLINARKEWHQTLENIPAWNNRLEPITATINHLQKVSERLHSIEDPESSHRDFKHLHQSSLEISAFRKETQTLVQGILKHKKDIDERLATIIQNYTPERVDPVDRAILRLASYEIQHRDDIPRTVSINEAIEIAKRFGTTDSPRFINGVLDSL